MNRLRFPLLVPCGLALILLQAACSNAYIVHFNLGIAQVSRDSLVLASDSSGALEYADTAFRFRWTPISTFEGVLGFCFEMDNRLSGPVIVDWPQTEFIGLDGIPQPVVTPGSPMMPFRDTVAAAPAVPPRSTLRQFVIPARSLKGSKPVKGNQGWSLCGWVADPNLKALIPFLERAWPLSPAKLDRQASAWVHRRFTINVPIAVDGKVQKYHFELTVSGYGITHYVDF